MQQNHRHRHKRLSGAAIVVVLFCGARLYAGVLLGIRTGGNRLEKLVASERVGPLDGRFVSEALTIQYGGRIWSYRERELMNLLLIGMDWAEMKLPVFSDATPDRRTICYS